MVGKQTRVETWHESNGYWYGGLAVKHTNSRIGCGVGGPLRNIARFSKAQVLGLNNNEYQVSRARRIAADCKMGNLAAFIKGEHLVRS